MTRDLLRRAGQQPAGLRVLAAARRRRIDVVAVKGNLRYDVRAAFDAGLLGDLIIHEADIVVVLERRTEIRYRVALRRCWAAIASGADTTVPQAVDELTRQLDDVGTTRAAAIRAELEIGR